MNWVKRKTMAVAAGVVVAGLLANEVISNSGMKREEVLADGSVMRLSQVMVGTNLEFATGSGLERLLGNAIPKTGLKVGRFKLERSRKLYVPITFSAEQSSMTVFNMPASAGNVLGAKVSLVGSNSARSNRSGPPEKYRLVIYGDDGFEYPQPQPVVFSFKTRSGSGLVESGVAQASRFPRVSRWLGFRFQKVEDARPFEDARTTGLHVTPFADFKVKNPARAVIKPWVTNALPVVVASTNGMSVIIKGVTAYKNKHGELGQFFVTSEVRSNGVVLLGDWQARLTHVEDASGNWDDSSNALDPRLIWKFDLDFQLMVDGPVTAVSLPMAGSTTATNITTNIMGVPVAIAYHDQFFHASIPANETNRGLRIVKTTRTEVPVLMGREKSGEIQFAFGVWGAPGGSTQPPEATFCVVPNIHVTFFAKVRVEER